MKIEKIKKVGSKYKLTLENKEVINTYDEVIIKHNLLYNKNIDSEKLKQINLDTRYYENYNKALNLINHRLRSESEIKDALKKKQVSEEETSKIINKLKNAGFINDEAFAKAYTNDKINLTLDGPNKIKKHLQKLKVNDEYINNAIKQIDKEIVLNHIDKIINKKIKANTKYPPYMLKQKIITYLINLGYSKSDIIMQLENAKIENQNFEKEMEKVYIKLNKKYQDKDLYLKLKNKLYSKGFSNEEINEFINKKQLN